MGQHRPVAGSVIVTRRLTATAAPCRPPIKVINKPIAKGIDALRHMPQPLREDLEEKITRIHGLPGVVKIILYGSYAKDMPNTDSDIDLAVFFSADKPCFLEEYRRLVKICNCAGADYQVQAFSIRELEDPCGIIEEIVEYGVELGNGI